MINIVKVRQDLSGQKFGRLTVVRQVDDYIDINGKHIPMYLCRCECENEFIARAYDIKKGSTTSCGCVATQTRINNGKLNKQHNIYDLTSYCYGVGYTNNNEEFYFDLEDYELIKDVCWYLNSKGYVVGKDCKTDEKILMHRLVTNCPNGYEPDHLDRNPLNNRKCNLVVGTHSDNMKNLSKYKNNTSGYTGVVWRKDTRKWRASINVNNKRINLGCFDDKEEAIQAYKKAKEKYHN